MADKKSTDDQRVVRLDMSIEHRMILRNRIETWRNAERDDSQTPAGMKSPEKARLRIATYERLIEALRTGMVTLPDEDAQVRLTGAARGFDDAEEWEETKVDHDSLWSLLNAIGGPLEEEGSGAPLMLPGRRGTTISRWSRWSSSGCWTCTPLTSARASWSSNSSANKPTSVSGLRDRLSLAFLQAENDSTDHLTRARASARAVQPGSERLPGCGYRC